MSTIRTPSHGGGPRRVAATRTPTSRSGLAPSPWQLAGIGAVDAATRATLLQRLQRGAGNAAVGTVLSRQPAGDADLAAPATSKPIRVHLAGDRRVSFTSAVGRVGSVEVTLSGHLSMNGTSTLTATDLPPRPTPRWAAVRLHELAAKHLTAMVPGGAAAPSVPPRFRASIGGLPLDVVLSPAADLSQTFHVLAAFVVGRPRAGVDLTLPGAAFNGRVALDVTMTITPADPAKGANTASAIGIDESAVTSVDFAGQKGVLRVARNAVGGKEGRGGNVGVVGEAAVRAVSDQTIGQALHPKIRDHPRLNTPEKRRKFLVAMRHWFGSDDRTLQHFRDMDVAEVPQRGSVLLHRHAATRLEMVRDAMGGFDMMPRNNGVAWSFRDEFQTTMTQTHGRMHTLGYAVDYNAYETPHLKDPRVIALIRMLTGRSHRLDLGAYRTSAGKGRVPTVDSTGKLPAGFDRRSLIRHMGEVMTGADERAKQDIDKRPEVAAFFKLLDDEVRALERASNRFKTSLGGKKADLDRLREQWFDARKPQERAAVATQLPAVFSDWLARIRLHRGVLAGIAHVRGVDLANLQDSKTIAKTLRALKTAHRQVAKLRKHVDAGGKLTRWHDRRIAAWEALATPLSGQAPVPSGVIGPLTRQQTLEVLEGRIAAKEAMLIGQQHAYKTYGAELTEMKWEYDTLERVKDALADPTFVFPLKRGIRPKAGDPPISQLLEKGYFSTTDTSKAAEAFNLTFMQTMAKHGFEIGGAWNHPDPMHFELIVD